MLILDKDKCVELFLYCLTNVDHCRLNETLRFNFLLLVIES